MSTKHDCPDCRCWRRAEINEFKKLFDRDDGLRSPDGVCYSFSDALDGFAVHAEGCPNIGKGWLGPSYNCPKRGHWEGAWPAWATTPVSANE